LASWSLERQLKGWTDEQRHQKDLSKGEILEAYRDQLLSSDAAHNALETLGYSADESATLLALEEARRTREDARVVEQSVRTQFVTRRIDAQDAINTLRGFGVGEQRIASEMARWSIERDERRPDLSAAALEKAISLGVIDQGTAVARLRDKGYTEDDI